MSNSTQVTENQHYVPCCVLKFFKESDEAFDKKKKRIFHVIHKKNKIFPSTINDVMSAQLFYEHGKLPTNEIEKRLKKFEAWYSKKHGEMITLIEEYEAGKVKFSKVKAQAFNLIEPMIKMHLRSGAIMYELNYWQERNHPNYSLFRMLDRLLNHNYSIRFANALINFHEFSIIKSSSKNFIISDQFIATASLSFKAHFMNATNRTIGLRDVIVFLPLSKAYYICFYNGNKPTYIKENQLKQLTIDQTDEVNSVIMNNSYMQTAGPTYDTLNRALQKFKDDEPTAIYYGGGKVSGGVERRKEVFYYDRDRLIYDFVVSAFDYHRFFGVKKSEPCPCGSGNSFGECCRFKVREFDKFMERVKLQGKNKYYDPYGIPDCDFHQENIIEYHTRNRD